MTGEPYCLSIAAGVAKSTAGVCSSTSQSSQSSQTPGVWETSTTTTTTAPVDPDVIPPPVDTETPILNLNGENPATIDKGVTYGDLGARIINEEDKNLGIKAIVDGLDVGDQSGVSIDTSEVGSHTIEYYVVDEGGNRGSITRTVNVIDPFASTTPAEETASTTPPTEPEITEPEVEPVPEPSIEPVSNSASSTESLIESNPSGTATSTP